MNERMFLFKAAWPITQTHRQTDRQTNKHELLCLQRITNTSTKILKATNGKVTQNTTF